MNGSLVKALLWGAAVALYLGFGLEPTGWLFYEAHFALGVDWLYWGYSGFRGADYAMSIWSYQVLFCVGLGALIAALVYWRSSRKSV